MGGEGEREDCEGVGGRMTVAAFFRRRGGMDHTLEMDAERDELPVG